MDMHIAENLKRLRRAKDMTQEELAAYLGVSGQAVSKWETGSGVPDLPLLVTTAAFFGVSLDDLVGMSEVENASRRADLERKADELSRTNHPAEAAALYREILPAPFGSETSGILSWIADSERDRFPRAFEILEELERTVLPPAFIQEKIYPPHP